MTGQGIEYLGNLQRVADQEEKSLGLGPSWTRKEVPDSEFHVLGTLPATYREVRSCH
jgi:hypothetical protein